MTKTNVQSNSERYQEENLTINFTKNHHSKLSKMVVDYYKSVTNDESFGFNKFDDFEDEYPIILTYVSKQPELMKNSPIGIQIQASIEVSISNTEISYAYAVFIFDKIITLQSDGNKTIMY